MLDLKLENQRFRKEYLERKKPEATVSTSMGTNF